MDIVVVAAIIEQNGRFLLTRRQKGVHLEGHWEFPGGKVDRGESHVHALRRELIEELDTDADVFDLVLQTTHAYPERTVTLYFYRCDLVGTPRPMLGQEMKWIARRELRSLRFPPADEELLRILTAG